MRVRHFTLALMLALVASLVALPAYAQEPTFGLSQDDMDLITRANTALSETTAFSFDVALNVVIQAQGENVDINLNANGGINDIITPTGSALVNLNGTATNGDEVIPLQFEARVIDGNVYVNAVNPQTGEPTGWQGTTLENAFGSFEDGFEQGSGGMDLDSLTSDPQIAPIFDLLSSLDPETFISAQRVGNATVGGVDTVHFAVDLSIVDLIQSEQIGQLIGQQMGGGAEIPAEQMQMITQMFASLFEGAVIRLEQYISPDDVIVRRTVLTIDLNIDPAALGAGSASGGSIVIQLSLDANFSGFGEEVPVTVPEGAVMTELNTGSLPGVPVLGGTTTGTTTAATTETTDISAGEAVIVDYDGAAINFNYASNGGETITVTARSVVAGGIDTTLEVSNSNFSVFAYNDDHGTGNADLGRFDSQLVVELPAADTYTIALGSFSFASGQVELTVTSEAGVSGASTSGASTGGTSSTTTSSSGNVVSHGGTLAYNESVEGLVQDNAVYQIEFDGNSGDIVTITSNRTDNGFDSVLTLYLDGEELARNDDHGTDNRGFARYDSLISNFRLPETGTYTIEVRGFAYSGGTFELTLSN